MACRVRLSDQQKRRAARIAREKGLTCPNYGSADPVPEGAAHTHLDGGADIAMRCANCESTSEVALVLSPRKRRLLAYTRCRITQRQSLRNIARIDRES